MLTNNKTIRRRSPYLRHMPGTALALRLCELYTGGPCLMGHAKRCGDERSGRLPYFRRHALPRMLTTAGSLRWSG